MKPESLKAPLQVKKKERHIVSWSPEEDELLREQVAFHGIENWTSISAQFKDKTSRQCRRRWYTYLNSEGKKGGWSPEEDMLLCEAQKIFGNRWTEIAKVVSGRTDNAVKNRFSTLCKKRSKHEALSKENNDPSACTSNKRVFVHNEPIMSGSVELSVPMKHIRGEAGQQSQEGQTLRGVEFDTSFAQNRYHILEQGENHSPDMILPRQPLSIVDQNSNNAINLPSPYRCENKSGPAVYDGPSNKSDGSFLRKDDPKLTALLQQAEMLSSLALKVSSENTAQSLENAWKELNEYLVQNGGKSISADDFEMDFGIDEFNGLIDELKNNNALEQSSWSMEQAHEEYQDSSEYIATSEKQNDDATAKQIHIANCLQENEVDPDMSISQGEPNALSEDTQKQISEYDSPHQTVPTFQSLAEGIPTPNFTASEKQILFNILGMSSPAPSPNSTQRPSCKRALLESLR